MRRRLDRIIDGQVGPVAFLTWTPDASTLIRLRRQAAERWAPDTLLVYPGHGFLPTEEDDLVDALGPKVTFRSFEQFADAIGSESERTWNDIRSRGSTSTQSLNRSSHTPIIALSSGDADDLAALGYDAPGDRTERRGIGSSHVDIVVLRICRTILQANLRIAFGGSLRRGASFMQLLQDTVAAMPKQPVGNASLDDAADPETPLENWVAAPLASAYTVALRAAHAGSCRYYLVGDLVPEYVTRDEEAVCAARALSKLREGIANRSCITIAFAGKRWSFSGIMPGVAEEVLHAMEAAGPLRADPKQVRVLLLGEYGGVVREMVRYLIDEKASFPTALTFASQEAHASDKLRAILRGDPKLRDHIVQRYEDLKRCLDALREVAGLRPDTQLDELGITVRQWRDVMVSSSIDTTRRLLTNPILPTVMANAEKRNVTGVPL